MKIETLKIDVDLSKAKEATDALNALAEAAERARKALQALHGGPIEIDMDDPLTAQRFDALFASASVDCVSSLQLPKSPANPNAPRGL